MSNTIYDYIIIGSGLSGLSIACKLSQENKKVALVESLDIPGGSNKKISFSQGSINNGLRLMPNSDSSLKALQFLESLLGLKIITSSTDAQQEAQPLTFEAGQIKPFVGFGDTPPDFYEELQYFISSSNVKWNIEPYQWTQLLFEKFKGEFLPRSIVTKLNIENNKVESAVINGNKSLKATHFIFCGALKELNALIPENKMNQKLRQRLAKTNFWTLVGIDFCHGSHQCDFENVHVLNGTTQDEIGPCVGRFIAHPSSEEQFSQWLTFVDESEAEDTEVIAIALKKIKRQIKRAYPTAFENLKAERISITPLYSGISELKLQGNQTLPGIENLWIGTGQANPQRNMIGALMQAQLVLAALGLASEANPESSPEA